MDYGKGALVFTTWAIHIHSVTIAFSGGGIGNYYAGYDDDDDKDNNGRHKGRSGDASDRDDAIKAFLILAYLLYQHRPCRPRALVLVLQRRSCYITARLSLRRLTTRDHFLPRKCDSAC